MALASCGEIKITWHTRRNENHRLRRRRSRGVAASRNGAMAAMAYRSSLALGGVKRNDIVAARGGAENSAGAAAWRNGGEKIEI